MSCHRAFVDNYDHDPSWFDGYKYNYSYAGHLGKYNNLCPSHDNDDASNHKYDDNDKAHILSLPWHR